MNASQYGQLRAQLVADVEAIIVSERRYARWLVEHIAPVVPQIQRDFDAAFDLRPYWVNYAPLQRGRSPRNEGIPWIEVGEKVISTHVIRALTTATAQLTFPGLPSGSDVRLATHDAFIHVDVKVTGPNDRADEVVASPYQLSGDGARWQDGVLNNTVTIRGARAAMAFQPELPPFYLLHDQLLLCVTYFIKAVYSVQDTGHQPLVSLDLISAPNGILAFDIPDYNTQLVGLFIPGKDDQQKVKKRVRLRTTPLGQLASWRVQRLWPTPQVE